MTILILITGGTFDKEYNELTGQLFFKETHVPEMLQLGRARLLLNIKQLMMIDSLKITEAEKLAILKECKKSKENKIVIIHGTDTMVDTSRFLGKSIKNKTIILTGAIVPCSLTKSDGLFNLGSALSFVQTLPNGVYIVMHGKYFNWYNSRKNKYTGEFEELEK